MRKAVRKPVKYKPGSVKSAGYLRSITDTGVFRSGYNACPGCGGPKGYYAGLCAQCRGNFQLVDPVGRQRRKQEGNVRYALCGAPRSSKVLRATGVTCMHPAGFKTPHPGIGRCYLHHGLEPNQMLHALRIRADIEMREEAARKHRHLAQRKTQRKKRKKIRFKRDLPSYQRARRAAR